MLSRKDHLTQGIPLPGKLLDEIKELLSSVYKEQSRKVDKIFEVYGLVYPSELILTISFVDKAYKETPITCLFSSDIEAQSLALDQLKDIIGVYLDASGLIFDSVFQNFQREDFSWDWEEIEVNRQKLFYKMSRENISLTLEAEKILQKTLDDEREEEEET